MLRERPFQNMGFQVLAKNGQLGCILFWAKSSDSMILWLKAHPEGRKAASHAGIVLIRDNWLDISHKKHIIIKIM